MESNLIEEVVKKFSDEKHKIMMQKGIDKISEYLDLLEMTPTSRTVLLRKILDKLLTERPYEALQNATTNATTIELIDTIEILLNIAIAEITGPYDERIRTSIPEIEKTEDGVTLKW